MEKIKDLFSISVTNGVKFDLFTSQYRIPAANTWVNRVSIPALDQYIYEKISGQTLSNKWQSSTIISEFPEVENLVHAVRQSYFNSIFNAHEYELNGLAESMFFDYEPLVNYDRTETQTHDDTNVIGGKTATTNYGQRQSSGSSTDSGRSDSSENHRTAFDTADYAKGTDKNDTTVGSSTGTFSQTENAATDTVTDSGSTDTNNGGYTLRAKGNIGTVSSQAMLESERQVRMFNFFDRIVVILQSEICDTNWDIEIDYTFESSGSGGGGSTPVDAYTKAQTDALLLFKADKTEVYTKSQTYSKSEMDESLRLKTNLSDFRPFESLTDYRLDTLETHDTNMSIRVSQIEGHVNGLGQIQSRMSDQITVMNNRYNEEIKFPFAIQDGVYGYIERGEGADTFHPFRSGGNNIHISMYRSLKKADDGLQNYEDITPDIFTPVSSIELTNNGTYFDAINDCNINMIIIPQAAGGSNTNNTSIEVRQRRGDDVNVIGTINGFGSSKALNQILDVEMLANDSLRIKNTYAGWFTIGTIIFVEVVE